MSAGSLVWLGLSAVLLQSGAVIVARHFLEVHHERPLSIKGRWIIVTGGILTEFTLIATMSSPSTLHGLFSLIFLAFLTLFIYLDAASRCLPRCFTLAFSITGAVFRFLLYPETRLPAVLTALSVFGGLWGLRNLAYRFNGRAQFGLGDVSLMSGLAMGFSFPEVFGLSVLPPFQGGFFCWPEEHAIRNSGKKTSTPVQPRLRRFYVG